MPLACCRQPSPPVPIKRSVQVSQAMPAMFGRKKVTARQRRHGSVRFFQEVVVSAGARDFSAASITSVHWEPWHDKDVSASNAVAAWLGQAVHKNSVQKATRIWVV